MANKSTVEATGVEKFWSRTIESWKNKNRQFRDELEKQAQSYRTMYYPRDSGTTGALAFDDALTVETNYYFAFADTLVAQVVPPNPQVTIAANRRALEGPAKFREALVNKVFEKERLSEKLWKLVTRGVIWPRCFLKVVWSEERQRPIFRVVNPHYIFFDMNAEDYEDIRYVIEVTPITRADFTKRLKKKGKKGGFYRTDAVDDVEFGKWPKWLEPDNDWADNPSVAEERPINVVRDEYEWTVIYEVYDFKAKKFYHFADETERPLMATDLPYEFLTNPYYMLTFNDNLRDLGGMSDAELIFPTVERLNELQSLKMWHAKASIPATVIHEGLVDDPDAFTDAYESIDGPGQAISLSAKPRVSISEVLGHTPVPSLAVEWNSAEDRLESIIEFVLGLPAYARGEVGQSDVATELALTDTATRTRNARRQKAVYNVIAWAARSVVGLFQEFMDEGQHIPARLVDGADEVLINREMMSFPEKADDPWTYDYAAHPFNASELNDVVQLKQFEVFLPVLLQAAAEGHLDQRELYKKLLDLLHMPNLLSDKPPEPQGQGMPGMEGMPPGMPPGGMQAAGGASPGMPTAAQAPMIGGEVMSGTGAQSVPGGLEGGAQPGGGGALGGMAQFGGQ